MDVNLHNLPVQPLNFLSSPEVKTHVLRLDKVHEVVSGNKWFKLKYYLQEAIQQQKDTIATFGGAYSNHIVATAFTARAYGLQSRGFIRGDASVNLSPTLVQARLYGMELVFIDRATYQNKAAIIAAHQRPNFYWIAEGGYGKPGAAGTAEIWDLPVLAANDYTDVICATGTGTMMAGLVNKAGPGQKVTGISVLKNNLTIEAEIRALLLPSAIEKGFSVIQGYHFGGYGKHPPELLAFMKMLWEKEKLPTDIVYTAKLLFGVKDLIEKKYFPENSRLLVIHSGGLQGNQSLPEGSLPFS